MSASSRRNAAVFTVTAVPDPSVMSRVLELFAKRNLVPDHFSGSLCEGAEPLLEMRVEKAGLDDHLTGYLGRCMAQITYVTAVEVNGQPAL
jgi:hypothetical protein